MMKWADWLPVYQSPETHQQSYHLLNSDFEKCDLNSAFLEEILKESVLMRLSPKNYFLAVNATAGYNFWFY